MVGFYMSNIKIFRGKPKQASHSKTFQTSTGSMLPRAES